MRSWTLILAVLVACSTDDEDTDDDDAADTDVSDTDTPGDTDTTDTDTTDTDTTDTDTTPVTEDCSFEACGGDVVGVWTVVSFCFDDSVLSNPLEVLCSEATYDLDVDGTGSWTIDADMTYHFDYTTTTDTVATFPAACNGGKAACSDWEYAITGSTCTGDLAVECVCTKGESPPTPTTESGTWSYDGPNAVVFTSSVATVGNVGVEADTFAICQNANELTMRLELFPLQIFLTR